jgi:cellulose synthase/poly-beta-1,6-N-acetylglucosamine synthase-like glycosyltransferase
MDSFTILSTVKNIRPTVFPWLNSIVSQEIKEKYKIIIIDSESTDGTKEILKKFEENYNFIKVVEFESTQPEALNFAIENNYLYGNFVALIDGDCVAPRNWLSSLYKKLKENNVDAVGGPGLTPKDTNFVQKLIGLDTNMRFLSIPEGLVKRHPNMNLLIKRCALESLKFDKNLNMGYDADFCHRLNLNGYKLWYSPQAFVWHYHRSSLKSYFKQQFFNSKYFFVFGKKTNAAFKGDNINPLHMILQPLLLMIIFINLVAVFINPFFKLSLAIFSLVLLLLFSINVIKSFKLSRDLKSFLLYFIYLIRSMAWVLGVLSKLVDQVIFRIE